MPPAQREAGSTPAVAGTVVRDDAPRAVIKAIPGVELIEMERNRENCLCCGEILRSVSGYKLADDVQERNLNDMAQTGASYCVFNCPACRSSLSEKVARKGLKPVHIIDLCKMAIGEKEREVR